jgi:PAT family beta-lactamase induction signal transducer AmpG
MATRSTLGRGVRVPLGRKLAIVFLLYVIEGFPMGVFRDLWPVHFRREGMSLVDIGLVSGLTAAWSAKVLWSPLVDRFGERRHWIGGALLAMALSLVTLHFVDATRLSPLLWMALGTFCLASATQDIAIDAYTIGLMDRGEEGPANSVRATAYRIGMIASGSGLLILADSQGFGSAYLAGAALSAAMAASLLLVPRPSVPAASRQQTWRPLVRWLSREGSVPLLLFVLLYRLGDIAMGPMLKTFWVDRGFTNAEIALWSVGMGVAAFVVGAAIGGWVVWKLGIGRALWLLGGLALLSNLAYAWAASVPRTPASWLKTTVYGASIVESLCGGMASAAFMSFLMRICQKEHAAVQYALLTAVYALPGWFIGMGSGWITERVDYAAYFALTGAMALPAFAALPRARRFAAGAPTQG